jgi:hypothetical protein
MEARLGQTIVPPEYMAVPAHGQIDIGMPRKVLGGLWVNTSTDRVRDERVTDCMKVCKLTGLVLIRQKRCFLPFLPVFRRGRFVKPCLPGFGKVKCRLYFNLYTVKLCWRWQEAG